MEQIEVGVWTPWGYVWCVACNNWHAIEEDPTIAKTLRVEKVAANEDDFTMTTCDQCGKTIMVEGAAGILHAYKEAINSVPGLYAEMEQTGGMCSALRVEPAVTDPKGSDWVVVMTEDDGAILMGLYTRASWVEGEVEGSGLTDDQEWVYTTVGYDPARLVREVAATLL